MPHKAWDHFNDTERDQVRHRRAWHRGPSTCWMELVVLDDESINNNLEPGLDCGEPHPDVLVAADRRQRPETLHRDVYG